MTIALEWLEARSMGVACGVTAHAVLAGREVIVLSLIGLLVFFAIWTFASLAGLTPRQFLPPPWSVAAKFLDLVREPFSGYILQQHLFSSFTRFGMGFMVAALVGLPLGMAMGWFRWLDAIVSQPDACRPIALHRYSEIDSC